MKNKLLWLQIILVIGPFALLAALWNKLPARFPMHWNLQGEIDGWSSNRIEILILPLITLVVVALIHLVPRIDPRLRATLQKTDRMHAVLPILSVALAGLLDIIFANQVAASFNYSLLSGAMVTTGLLIVLAVMGNYLGNLQPNYFIGLRTPWTLESEDTWRATHRLGGRLLFFGALALLILSPFLKHDVLIFLFMTCTLLFVVWTFLYSWRHFRRSVTRATPRVLR